MNRNNIKRDIITSSPMWVPGTSWTALPRCRTRWRLYWKLELDKLGGVGDTVYPSQQVHPKAGRLAFLIPLPQPILYECLCRLPLFCIACHVNQFLCYPSNLAKISLPTAPPATKPWNSYSWERIYQPEKAPWHRPEEGSRSIVKADSDAPCRLSRQLGSICVSGWRKSARYG